MFSLPSKKPTHASFPDETRWHSAAHLVAAAVQKIHPHVQLAIGPAIEEGFYYDFGGVDAFTPQDLKKIEKEANKILAQNEPFVREEITKSEAQKLFAKQKYKRELLDELEEGNISIYRTGKFTDLCRGPHVERAKQVGVIRVLKSSAAYWRGDQKNDSLQRIYGIAFPDKQALDAWERQRAEAEARNHVKLGKELGLFSIHEQAPGTAFFHHKGTVLFNLLAQFWRDEHRKAGYTEVMTPMLLKRDLWETSGHWGYYKENMYTTKIDDYDFAIKPMNCPGGILVYQTELHSYRELPMRVAELGTVHRHELSGVLNGLFRVRKFTQDDAHLYCTPDQIEDEVSGVIDLVQKMYAAFGFRAYDFELSTRPEKSVGSDEIWEKATGALEHVLKKRGIKYAVDEGEGVFYGPKIDIKIRDSLNRKWQCGTIQVDFNLPARFKMEYVDADGSRKTPIMIHRVIYGSLERFLGVLIEHFAGAFPLWLAPVQTVVFAVSDDHGAYAQRVTKQLFDAGLRAEYDGRSETVSYKVRDAQKQKIPYAIVVGAREEKDGTVTVRNRAGKQKTLKIAEFLSAAKEEIGQKALEPFF